jgi:hypothetical protein
MTLYYDNTGKVIPEGDLGHDGPINTLEIDEALIPAGDFPVSYLGEIYFDDLHLCIKDDREIRYWYEVQDGKLVKIGWPERMARGEFTLEQFREKALQALLRNYQLEAAKTDSVFLMYSKRDAAGILVEDDSEKYQAAVLEYAKITQDYHANKEIAQQSESIEELSELFQRGQS